MNTDRSQVRYTSQLRSKALATFHRLYPNKREGGNTVLLGSEHIHRSLGQLDTECCIKPLLIPNAILRPSALILRFSLSWDTVEGATSYQLTSTSNFIEIIYNQGETNAIINIIFFTINEDGSSTPTSINLSDIRLTATTPSGNVIIPIEVEGGGVCFLGESVIHMADGTVKCIKDIKVGDLLIGAFGEINSVIALYPSIVGNNLMCNINNEHHATYHHPHLSCDKQWYCANPEIIVKENYGKLHRVIDANGKPFDMMMPGLKHPQFNKLELGTHLKTIDGGRIVETLELYNLPFDTPLYNLVVDGSHTYHVDGYVVSGWLRDDDFNYDLWEPI